MVMSPSIRLAIVTKFPAGFDVFASLDDQHNAHTATLDIRKGKAHLLRNTAITSIDKGEWDRVTVNYFDTQRFIDLILWHSDDALVIQPSELRAGIIAALETIVRHHG